MTFKPKHHTAVVLHSTRQSLADVAPRVARGWLLSERCFRTLRRGPLLSALRRIQPSRHRTVPLEVHTLPQALFASAVVTHSSSVPCRRIERRYNHSGLVFSTRHNSSSDPSLEVHRPIMFVQSSIDFFSTPAYDVGHSLVPGGPRLPGVRSTRPRLRLPRWRACVRCRDIPGRDAEETRIRVSLCGVIKEQSAAAFGQCGSQPMSPKALGKISGSGTRPRAPVFQQGGSATSAHPPRA